MDTQIESRKGGLKVSEINMWKLLKGQTHSLEQSFPRMNI